MLLGCSVRAVLGHAASCVRQYRAAFILLDTLPRVDDASTVKTYHRIYRPADSDVAPKKTPSAAKQRQKVQPSDELIQLHKEFSNTKKENEATKNSTGTEKAAISDASNNKQKIPRSEKRGNKRESVSQRVLFSPQPAIKSAATETDRKLQQQKQLNRIYVGNLSYKVTNKAFAEFVSQAGKVNYAEVLKDEFGVSKGCGIAEYDDIAHANAAILQLHDVELLGRKVFVREDREEFILRPKDPNLVDTSYLANSVFVGNIHPTVTRYDLKRHMSQAGEVVQANITYDRRHFFTGAGIVVYKTVEAMRRAVMDLHETKLKKQLIFVREDREKVGYEKTQVLKIKSHKNSDFCVYISNLPFRVTENEVAEALRQIGAVKKVVLWEEDGRTRGNGTVEFETSDAVKKLLTLREKITIRDRKIAVKPYTRPGTTKKSDNSERASNINRSVKASGSI